VAAFLDDAGQYFRSRPVILIIDDLALDAILGPALLAAGCSPDEDEIFLALAGPIHEQVVMPGLLVKPVSEPNLTDFSVTKLKAFAESEDRPDEVRLVAEIIRRREELTGSGRGLIAQLDGASGAMLWSHDDGQDVWINLLATRVPYRGLGLATALLQHCLAESYANGRRSIIINVKTKNNEAIRLYNRLGFTDEIYHRRQYLLER
jgi:ribosomal protein S18 acetylase RimI-like enzyme